MKPIISLNLFSSLFLLSIVRAQDRAPHGIANASPVAFSPSAYDFFHPKSEQPNGKNPCLESDCSPLPMAAEVIASNKAYESKKSSGSGVGIGGVTGIVFGFVFAILLAMGAYYIVNTRRANVNRANSVRPDV